MCLGIGLLGFCFLGSRLLASCFLDSRLSASRLSDSRLLRVAGLRVVGRWVAGLWVASRWVVGFWVAGFSRRCLGKVCVAHAPPYLAHAREGGERLERLGSTKREEENLYCIKLTLDARGAHPLTRACSKYQGGIKYVELMPSHNPICSERVEHSRARTPNTRGVKYVDSQRCQK